MIKKSMQLYQIFLTHYLSSFPYVSNIIAWFLNVYNVCEATDRTLALLLVENAGGNDFWTVLGKKHV